MPSRPQTGWKMRGQATPPVLIASGYGAFGFRKNDVDLVQAFNADGSSRFSNVASTDTYAPNAPTGLLGNFAI